MFTKVVVEIVSGELCRNGQVLYVDCDKVVRQGEERRRMVTPQGKKQDISAFYFTISGIEYGKIGAREVDFSNLCNHCCGDTGTESSGSWGEYNDDYTEDFFI